MIQLKNLNENETNQVVMRYMSLEKFEHILENSSIWFSKLDGFEDVLEGISPHPIKNHILDHHNILLMDQNESTGKQTVIVSCWIMSDSEFQYMWEEFVGPDEGVAVVTTISKLTQFIHLYNDYSFIGRVNYVDYKTYKMPPHLSGQSIERAFLKDLKFEREKELRIASLFFPQRGDIQAVAATPRFLIDHVILNPKANGKYEQKIRELVNGYQLKCKISRSIFD